MNTVIIEFGAPLTMEAIVKGEQWWEFPNEHREAVDASNCIELMNIESGRTLFLTGPTGLEKSIELATKTAAMVVLALEGQPTHWRVTR